MSEYEAGADLAVEVPAAPLERSEVEDPSIKAIADFKNHLKEEQKRKMGGQGAHDPPPIPDLEVKDFACFAVRT